MKKTSLFILLYFGIVTHSFSQSENNCLPKDFVVTAENLNFRSSPNVESKSLGTFNNGELLTIHNDMFKGKKLRQEFDYRYFHGSWIKVKRNKTGEIGYVFGDYIKPQNIAYLNSQSCDRIQNGNWYGIFKDDEKIFMKKITPSLEGMVMDGFRVISSGAKKHKIIIGSHEELNEGKLNAQFFPSRGETIKIGTNKKLVKINNHEFSIAMTGNIKLNQPFLISENQKLYFITNQIKNQDKVFISQEIGSCLIGYGDVGVQIHFVGDLNNDGTPELILSESDETQGMTLYFFMSNKEGKLELKSMTGSVSGC